MEDDQKDGHITILWGAPVILTRDRAFVDNMKAEYANNPMRPGQLLLLPPDAVLVRLPQVVGVPTTQVNKEDPGSDEKVIT